MLSLKVTYGHGNTLSAGYQAGELRLNPLTTLTTSLEILGPKVSSIGTEAVNRLNKESNYKFSPRVNVFTQR